MRDRTERFVAFPFSLSCVSQASIAVVEDRPKRSKPSFKSPTSFETDEDEDQESLSGESLKQNSSRLLAFPKPNFSTGVNRLVKGLKSLSQLFIYEDEMEGLGMEMEIGCPTDVKHVAHIGWDGTTTTHLTTDDDDAWHHLFTPLQLLPMQQHLHHSPAPPIPNASS